MQDLFRGISSYFEGSGRIFWKLRLNNLSLESAGKAEMIIHFLEIIISLKLSYNHGQILKENYYFYKYNNAKT